MSPLFAIPRKERGGAMVPQPVGSTNDSALERRLVRRTFLKTLLGTTGLVAASSLLAACGNAATSPARTSAPAAAKRAEAPKPAESKPAESKPAAPAAAAPATAAPAAAKPAGAGGKLEMFSWWTT